MIYTPVVATAVSCYSLVPLLRFNHYFSLLWTRRLFKLLYVYGTEYSQTTTRGGAAAAAAAPAAEVAGTARAAHVRQSVKTGGRPNGFVAFSFRF